MPSCKTPDGITESRRQTLSVFNGPSPVVKICDSEQSEIETVRHLLYVAATRAREHLLITTRSPGSEFRSDLR